MIACSTYKQRREASMELARLFVPRNPFHSTWEEMKAGQLRTQAVFAVRRRAFA
jgi:hypothetical protein